MMSLITLAKKTSAVLRPLDARSSFDKFETPFAQNKRHTRRGMADRHVDRIM